MTHPLHDTHAIPATDEPEQEIKPGDVFRDRDGDEWAAVTTDNGLVRLFWHYKPGDEINYTPGCTLEEVDAVYGPITKVEPAAEQVKSCPSCPQCGKTFHVTDEPELADWERDLLASSAPIKTHDLSIVKRDGNVVITVENELEDHQVYLQDGVALDLGRVLAGLTPAQRQLLVDDLVGGDQ